MNKLTIAGLFLTLAACSEGEQAQGQNTALNEANTAAEASPQTASSAVAEPSKAAPDLAAAAGAYRWNTGFGQGISEALVRNSRAEDLNISVDTNSEYNDGTEVEGSVFLTVQPELKPDEEFYILVGDRNFTFVSGGDGTTATDRRQLADLINTLKATKSPFIKVEIPSRNYVTAFSTNGMREALGS